MSWRNCGNYRPTWAVRCPKSEHSSLYEIPCVVKFPSGYEEELWAEGPLDPRVIGVGSCVGGTISPQLLDRAGGPSRNNVTKWTREWGPFNEELAALTITIPQSRDILKTQTLVVVKKVSRYYDFRLDVASLASMADVVVCGKYLSLNYPKTQHFDRKSIDDLISSAVLVLGSYAGRDFLQLREIATYLTVHGLEPWIMRDYYDLPERDVTQKLFTMASCSRAIVVLDSKPSGHLIELQALSALSTPTIVLRARGKRGNWMADPILGRPNVALIEIEKRDPTALLAAVGSAASWIDSMIQGSATVLDKRYPWRRAELRFAKEVFKIFHG